MTSHSGTYNYLEGGARRLPPAGYASASVPFHFRRTAFFTDSCCRLEHTAQTIYIAGFISKPTHIVW